LPHGGKWLLLRCDDAHKFLCIIQFTYQCGCIYDYRTIFYSRVYQQLVIHLTPGFCKPSLSLRVDKPGRVPLSSLDWTDRFRDWGWVVGRWVCTRIAHGTPTRHIAHRTHGRRDPGFVRNRIFYARPHSSFVSVRHASDVLPELCLLIGKDARNLIVVELGWWRSCLCSDSQVQDDLYNYPCQRALNVRWRRSFPDLDASTTSWQSARPWQAPATRLTVIDAEKHLTNQRICNPNAQR
jgi:hypothetical protein